MNRYLVRIKAIPAWQGNPDDPVFWNYRVFARSPEGAKAVCRAYPNVTAGMAMETYRLPDWPHPFP